MLKVIVPTCNLSIYISMVMTSGAMGKPPGRKFFPFLAEQLCLDFVNTQVAGQDAPRELLTSFDDLVDWLIQAQVFESRVVQAALKHWGEGEDVARVLKQARALRASLRALAERLVQGKSVPLGTVEAINAVLAVQRSPTQLVHNRGGYEHRRQIELKQPLELLVPIAESAAELLVHGDHSLVKKCGNPACILYFYDTTRNHRRRWCSMATCGNRIKAAVHYRRSRGARA